MGTPRIVSAGSFVATDQGGRQHTVFIFRAFISVASNMAPHEELQVANQYRLADGRKVIGDRFAPGQFQVEHTMILLTTPNPPEDPLP